MIIMDLTSKSQLAKDNMTLLLTALPEKGVLVVTGEDAQTFLQGQCTCDVLAVKPDRSTLGAHCNIQGRVQSLFRLMAVPTKGSQLFYALIMPKSLLSRAAAVFQKYAMFSKVQLVVLNDSIDAIGVSGQTAKAQLSHFFPDMDFDEKDAVAWRMDGKQIPLSIYRVSGSTPRYEIVGESAAVQALFSKLKDITLEKSSAYWEQMDIAAMLPAVYPETVDQFLPHHLGLVELGAVSFDKGCYLGQEIVARMQWRGNIKKHIKKGVIGQVDTPPRPGGLLYGLDKTDKPLPVGQVVRVSPTQTGAFHLLYVLKDGEVAQFDNQVIETLK